MSEHSRDRAVPSPSRTLATTSPPVIDPSIPDTSVPSLIQELMAERRGWRESVLSGLLWTATATGLLTLLLLALQGVLERGFGAVLVVAFGGACLGIGSRVPLEARALLLMLSIYVACVIQLAGLGFAPNSLVAFAFLVAMATLLLGRRAGIATVVTCVVTLTTIALLHHYELLVRPPTWWAAFDTANLQGVARVVIIFSGAMSALVIGFSHLLERTETLAREKAKSLAALQQAELERERITKTLEQRDAADRRARELELLGRLASYAAHDFNNALFVIQGNAELARRSMADPQEFDAALRAIELAAHDAASTSRQLLALGTRQPTPGKNLSLADQAQRAGRLLQRILSTQIEVHVRAESTPAIHADEGGIQRILINLALNARDAMPKGGILQLRVRNAQPHELDDTECDEDFVVLEVSDSGSGMDPDTVGRLFEPSFTTKGEQGTGLGLASTHELVERTGGRIEVESEPGRGTRFSIYWPVAEHERPSLYGRGHRPQLDART